MPYSIMVWLTSNSDGPRQEAEPNETPDRRHLPGAASGFTAGPAATFLNYGFYENEAQAESALKDIAKELRQNEPLRIKSEERTYLIPASRIYYVVCDAVVRPKDEVGAGTGYGAAVGPGRG